MTEPRTDHEVQPGESTARPAKRGQTVVILNPTAGRAAHASVIRRWCEKRDAVTLHVTQGPGDARRLASEAIDAGVTQLIVASGDGLIGEVVDGMSPRFDAATLAIVPLGTGNDLARSIDVPRRIDAALRLVEHGSVRRIDVVRAASPTGDRHFVNAATGGLSRDARLRLNRDLKRWLGPVSYLLAGMLAMRRLNWHRAQFEFDHTTLDARICHVTVTNGRTVGGGQRVCPEAVLDDGRIDVTGTQAATWWERARLFGWFLMGKYHRSPNVVYRRVSRVRIEGAPPIPFNLDGEPGVQTPVTFEVLPRALRLVVGPNAALRAAADKGDLTATRDEGSIGAKATPAALASALEGSDPPKATSTVEGSASTESGAPQASHEREVEPR